MDNNNLNEKIVSKILNSIPSNIKPINYLMDMLDMGRESAYRRMRGEISFNIEEIAKLSVELGFSIDELLKESKGNHVLFDLPIDRHDDTSKAFMVMLQQYRDQLIHRIEAKDAEALMTLNLIPATFTSFFDNLFKYSYYRWVHQTNESSLSYRLSDVVLPTEITDLQKEIRENIRKTNKSVYILDPNMFVNTIRGIQYYYRRKLINEEELRLLKKDLLALVDLLEKLMQTGVLEPKAKFFFYLSSVSIEANSTYSRYDNHCLSHFQIYLTNPIVVHNSELCVIHRNWLESLKKYSTLITRSQEILQIRFLNQQRIYIENLENEISNTLF
ncbi:helix-turn-helix domain-containing protein [Viscerimonas tarda]